MINFGGDESRNALRRNASEPNAGAAKFVQIVHNSPAASVAGVKLGCLIVAFSAAKTLGMKPAKSFAEGEFLAMNGTTNPTAERSAQLAATTQTAPAPINIWLVDDNQRIRSAVMGLLETCKDVRCTAEFHSPNAVLSALASKTGPDVILLDIQMGEANGLDAIRPIKALSRSTQVLMFTTCFDSESKKRAFTNGASDFLLKNFPLERILDSIQRASQNPAPHLKCAPRQKSPPRPRHWLQHCLDLIHFRWN